MKQDFAERAGAALVLVSVSTIMPTASGSSDAGDCLMTYSATAPKTRPRWSENRFQSVRPGCFESKRPSSSFSQAGGGSSTARI